MRDGPRWFPQNSSCSAVLRCRLASRLAFRVRACHPLRTNFPDGSATPMTAARRRSYNPGRGRKTAPVWAPARSLATTCAIILIFSSSGYLDVSVPRVRPPRQPRRDGIPSIGFPHSDIRGSLGICPSPRLFAACHVLRRLREPQASPMRPLLLSLYPSTGHAAVRRAPGLLDLIRSFARLFSQLDFSLRFILFAFPTCQ